MTLTNGAVKAALDAMQALCGPTNRLPVVASLRADRTLRALATAWEPCERVRMQLLRDHGETNGEQVSISPHMPGWPAFAEAYNEMGAEEVEVAVEPLKLSDIEQGYARDAETGKKEPLDISPAQLGALVELGLIETGPALAKDVA
jgi:hypothetical protein